MRALARQLQLENRDLRDVHIGYIAPGGVDTPIYQQAATYVGAPGRPPPPVASPERVARAALARAGRSRARQQVGWSNDLIRFGFTALPRVFDMLGGPLFGVAAMDRTEPRPSGPGNVLQPGQDNAVRGSQGNAALGIARNLRLALRAATAHTPRARLVRGESGLIAAGTTDYGTGRPRRCPTWWRVGERGD